MKLLKQFSVVALLLILVPTVSQAQFRGRNHWKQFRAEWSIGIGASNFLGELGGRDRVGSDLFWDLEFSQTHFAASGMYRYFVTERTSLRGNASYGIIRGDDQTTAEAFRNNRNLNFRSPIYELSLVYEFHLMQESDGARYRIKGAKGLPNSFIGAYGYVGLGGFYFNPKGRIGNQWHSLRPYGTEGQGLVGGGSKYSNFSLAIPIGFGLRKNLGKGSRLGLDLGVRKTFTDYIDDVSGVYFDNDQIRQQNGEAAAYFADPSLGRFPGSTDAGLQRGDPTDMDAYLFALVTYTKKISRKPKFRRRVRSRRSMPSF